MAELAGREEACGPTLNLLPEAPGVQCWGSGGQGGVGVFHLFALFCLLLLLFIDASFGFLHPNSEPPAKNCPQRSREKPRVF